MTAEILFALSILLFMASSRGLLSALTSSGPYFVNVEYSKKAQKFGRAYKIFAWGLLSLFLLASAAASFIETFLNL